MANYGGATQTPYHPVGSALYGEKNELIAFKPQVLSDSTNDWWFGAGSPDWTGSITARDKGMIFYSQRAADTQLGKLCWIDEVQTTRGDMAWAAPGNRSTTIIGLWNFAPTTGLAPFTVPISRNGVVANLNADMTDGFHAERIECGTGMLAAENKIPVYKALGKLSVGDPIEGCDAINLAFFQANQIGVTAMKPVQWATVNAQSVTVSDGGMTLTSTVNGIFNPDIDARPGIGDPVGNTNETLAHRVLIKDQWSSGPNTPAIQNGIYYVYNAGSPTTTFVLKRASDANQDGELARGNLVFVEYGGKNAGSQFQLTDKSPGDGTTYGPAINPGVEPNWWQLFFRVSVYVGGRGIKLDGQTIHFGKLTKYTMGSAWVSDTEDSVNEVVPIVDNATAKRFLGHPNTASTLPNWHFVTWNDVTGKPAFVPVGHTHTPNEITGGVANAVAAYGPTGLLTVGTNQFTYDQAASRVYIGVAGTPPTSGPSLYYPSAALDASGANLLTFDTTSGKVGHRTAASLITGLWPSQSGTAGYHARWVLAGENAGIRLEDSLVYDDLNVSPYAVVPKTGSNVSLGSLAKQFIAVVAGGANLGGLTLSTDYKAGDFPGMLLGVDQTNTDRQSVHGYSSIPNGFVSTGTIGINAIAYGGADGRLSGDSSKLFFDGNNMLIKDGTVAAPAIGFLASGQNSTGIFRPAALQVGIATNGVQAMTVAQTFTSVARDFYSEAHQVGSLGTTTKQWGQFYLSPTAATLGVSGLAGWSTAANGKVESFDATKVKAWLGVASNTVTGQGTTDHFTLWTSASQLGTAPFKVDNALVLNVSKRHLAPEVTNTYDLGFSSSSGTGFGASVLTGTNSNFDSGIGNWSAYGPFMTVTATGGRMVLTTASGALTHGTVLANGIANVTAGKRYRISFKTKVDGAMPNLTTAWEVQDPSGNLTFDSGQYFSPNNTGDQTISAFATAGVNGTFQLLFVEGLGQVPYTVSFETVEVCEVITGAATSIRWRTLFVHNIDVSTSLIPTTDKGVSLGSTGPALETEKHRRFSSIYVGADALATTPVSLAGWVSDPSTVSPPVPLGQVSKSQVLSFIGFPIGTQNRLTRWSADGLVDSSFVQATFSLHPVSDKGGGLGGPSNRWASFFTDAAAGTTVAYVSGWEADPSVMPAPGPALRKYTGPQVRTFIGLDSAVTLANGSGTINRMTKWTGAGGVLGDSEIHQTTTEMTPITDATTSALGITLGKTSARWKSFWTRAEASTGLAYLSGWDTDPNAGSGAALVRATPANVRGWLGLGSGAAGTGTPFVVTKWNSAGGGPVDSRITEVESTPAGDYGLRVGEYAFLDGLIEPYSHAAYINASRHQIRAGFYTNELSNFDVGNPAIVAPNPPSLTMTGSVAVSGTGLWRAVYLPGGGGTYLSGFRSMAPVWTGTGDAVFEFTATRIWYSGTIIWTPYILFRRALDANLVTAIKVEYRGGDGATWFTSSNEAPPKYNLASPAAWVGADFTPANTGNIFTGIRFTLTMLNAVDLRILEIGVANIYMTPGTGTVGLLHTPNRWQQPNLYLSYATNQTGAGTEACGSATAPMIALRQANTGFYSGTAGEIHFTANGNRTMTLTSSGLAIGSLTPTALLEFSAGLTTRAPVHFAGSGNSLLTTVVAGSLETDNTRLYFTNTINNITSRHGLAMVDEVNFTNDANAENAGCVNFYSINNGNHFAISTLTGVTLGTADVSVAVRCRFPIGSTTVNTYLWALTSATGGGGGAPHDWLMAFGNGTLNFTIRDPAGSINGRNWGISAANMAQFLGRVVDLVVVRTSGVISIWINGLNLTPTPTGTAYEGMPVCNGLPMFFHTGGMHNTAPVWQERVYSARIYNRALSLADLLDLSRYGVNEQDKWPVTSSIYSSVGKWGASADGWFGGSASVAFAQAIGGKTDTLKVTATATSYVLATRNSTLTRFKRYRCEGNYYIPASNTNTRRIFVAFFNSTPNRFIQTAPTLDTWTAFTVESGQDQNTTGSTTNIELDFANAAGSWAGPFVVGEAVYFDSVIATQVGCLIDLDFGKVIGTSVYDWSGRYPAKLSGVYEVVRPKHSTITVTDGNGTLTVNLRKFVQRISAKDGDKIPITHNLGLTTYGYSVTAWDIALAHNLTVGFVRTGDNTMDVTFDSIGAPSATKQIEIVIIA